MNKERLIYRFVQKEIISSYLQSSLSSLPHGFRRASPASLSLTVPETLSRLPACLTSFCLPHASGLPHQLLSPSRFRRYDEMAEISRGIEKRKTKLNSLRWQTQQGISSIAFQRLRVDAEQLNKVREFGLKKAGMHSKLL
ncbi:hypothetical protein AB3S75_036219 [Citrus x aurantiifolia]